MLGDFSKFLRDFVLLMISCVTSVSYVGYDVIKQTKSAVYCVIKENNYNYIDISTI